MPLADPVMLMVPRAPNPRLSHGSSIIDFHSRVLHEATVSPAIPPPLQVSRATPSTEPRVVQPTSDSNDPDTTNQPARTRCQNLGSLQNRKAFALDGFVYSSGPTRTRVPVPRLNTVLSKPPQIFLKPAHRSLRLRIKAFPRSPMFSRRAAVMQRRRRISSPFNPVHVDGDPVSGGNLAMVRYPELVVEAPASRDQTPRMGVDGRDRREIRTGWEAEGNVDPLRSNIQTRSSLKLAPSSVSQLQSQRDEISRLLKDRFRLRHEIVSLQEQHNLELTKVREKHEFQLAQTKEAYQMELNSQQVRGDHYERKCKRITIDSKSRETQLKSQTVRDQFTTLKSDIAELKASLIAEQVKSSNHLARSNHYKMMYEMEIERQAQAAAVIAAAVVPVSTPVVHEEVTLRGGGSQPESKVSVTQPEQNQNPSIKSQQLTATARPCRADIMCPTSMEAENPSTKSSIAEILSLPAITIALRILALSELLSHRCMSPCGGDVRRFQGEVVPQLPLTITNPPSLERPSGIEQIQIDDVILEGTDVDVETGVETDLGTDVIARLNNRQWCRMLELRLADPRSASVRK
ncbi:hypothetical protein IFR05_015079 [Cadophora sp. M221]|nr:hypothetical protein IFR05_015079 [Cadophora sp. M221]